MAQLTFKRENIGLTISAGLPDGTFSKQKSQFGQILKGL
jgi:hypothetical protein